MLRKVGNRLYLNESPFKKMLGSWSSYMNSGGIIKSSSDCICVDFETKVVEGSKDSFNNIVNYIKGKYGNDLPEEVYNNKFMCEYFIGV